MTDFDKTLIEKANQIKRFDYKDIDTLIRYADTQEAIDNLWIIRQSLLDLVMETL